MEGAQTSQAFLHPAEDYFNEAHAVFEKAVAVSGGIRRFYKIGMEIICLRFAGGMLTEVLAPALAHLEITGGAPSLTLCIWDSETTQTSMPAPPWPLTAYGVKGHIEGYNTDRIRTLYQPGSNMLNMIDRLKGLGLCWMEHPDAIAYWDRSFPFRGLLHWWSEERNYQLVHAGAVGTEKGGVLLAGKGGSGKSTTTTLCIQSSLRYAGDDYVLIEPGTSPHVYSLYNAAKLNAKSLAMLPKLAEKIVNPDFTADEKGLIFLHQHYPQAMISGFPVKALFLPRVTGQTDTCLAPASAAEGLLALAPTTLMQLEGDSKLAYDKMRRFVQSVPVYRLELGMDLAQIPVVVSRFLEGA